MKTKIFSFVTALAMIIGLSSCHESAEVAPVVNETGSVNLKSLGIDVSNAEKVIETSRASIDLSDYTIQILSDKGVIAKEWKYSEMPEVFELPVGTYTARVYSHEVQAAEWDSPYFVGEKIFDIKNDEITDLGVVTCVLANIKVSILYTDALRELMGDDVKVTVVANESGRLEFTPDETRSGYFKALEGSSTIIVEFTGTVNGYYETLRHTITDADAGQHRKITFKIKAPTPPPGTDPTGSISPGDGVYLDLDVDDEDLRFNIPNEEDIIPDTNRPGGEDPGPGPGPDKPDDPTPENTIVITSDNLSFDNVNMVNDLDGKDAIVDIAAPKGITHFLVKIESSNDNFIASAGELLPLSFDLAYPGPSASDFESIGFPTGDDVLGKTYLKFDITQFVPLLAAFPGTHHFTLTVQDADNMQLIKVLTFIAE